MVEPIHLTAFDMAQRFVGMKEVPGSKNNDAVMAMLRLDQSWPGSDEVAWCSAFVNYVAWLLRLPRSKSLAARSWLEVGTPTMAPVAGFDVVVLKRGTNPVSGHVGFFAGWGMDQSRVLILGGNQGNQVSIAEFSYTDVLGYRALKTQ